MAEDKRKSTAGKGDKARNNHSKKFKENYDKIKWRKTPKVNPD